MTALMLMCLPALAGPTHELQDPDKQLPKGDEAALNALVAKFFEPLIEYGAEAAVKSITNSAPFNVEFLLAPLSRLDQMAWAGPAQDYEIVHTHILGLAARELDLRVATYHHYGVMGWRLRTYKHVDEGWVYTGIEVRSDYAQDFINLGEMEYDLLEKELE
jgi:hypothetical protein